MEIKSTTQIDLTEEDLRGLIASHVAVIAGPVEISDIQFRSGGRAMKAGALSARIVSNGTSGAAMPAPSPEPVQKINPDEAVKADCEAQGAAAKANRQSIKTNPYPENSLEGQAWLRGFTGGKRNHERERHNGF